MRVALAQIISSADPQANLAEITTTTEAAVARGAELVVFPEAAMCAFGNDLGAVAEPSTARGRRRCARWPAGSAPRSWRGPSRPARAVACATR
nr:hypothetical protein GCM10025699_63280 [Microbacterium flavescens]